MSTHHVTRRRPLGAGPGRRGSTDSRPQAVADTTVTTYRAQLVSALPDGPGWRLFVVLPGRVSEWPEARWSARNLPTFERRTEALAEMGYALADPTAGWDWTETQPWEEKPATPVELSAVAMVVPLS